MDNNTWNFNVRASMPHGAISRDIGLYIYKWNKDTVQYADAVTFKTVPEREFVDPAIHITFTQAQELMDSLWSCGIRPTEGAGSAGSLVATERHLEDMRKLVFKDKYEKSK